MEATQTKKEPKYKPIDKKRVENITVSLTLDTRKGGDAYPIAVRVNYNNRNYYHRTGEVIKLTNGRNRYSNWDALSKATGQRAKSGSGELYEKRKEQVKVFERVVDAVKELKDAGSFNFENLKAKLTGRYDESFSGLWSSIIEDKKSDGKAGTADSYTNGLKSFDKYIGEHVEFNRIGTEIVEKWVKKMKAGGLSETTIGIYLRSMRVVCNEAIERAYLKPAQYPFGKQRSKISIKKGRSRKDDFLDVEEILKLKSFITPSGWSKGVGDTVKEAVNMFLFSYLANGLNLMDIALLEWDSHYFETEGRELKFVRAKTADTASEVIEIIVPILEPLQAILDAYGSHPKQGARIFPNILKGSKDPNIIKKRVKDWNSNFGDRLKKACAEVGISKQVSMTYARHSFATNLTRKNVPERYIAQAMGHSNKTITAGYIGLFAPEDRRRYNELLLDPANKA